jgi:hypothetical protein
MPEPFLHPWPQRPDPEQMLKKFVTMMANIRHKVMRGRLLETQMLLVAEAAVSSQSLGAQQSPLLSLCCGKVRSAD